MLQQIVLQSRRTTLVVTAALLGLLSAAPVFMPALVYAAPPVTERQLQSTSAVAGDTTNLTWSFNTGADAGAVDYVEIEFCDTPLTACTTVDGAADNGATDNIPLLPGSPTAVVGGTGDWASDPAHTTARQDGRGSGNENQILIDFTSPLANGENEAVTISVAGITNDDEINTTYYTRLRIYSDTGTTLEWEGVFAQSTSQTLTVNARVQERLDFCVGATTVNAINTATGDCTAITAAGGTVDLGNVENGNVNVSPVATINGGSATPSNGAALIRTNAVNGASIAYRSLTETSSGALKVAGAQCSDGVAPPVAVSTVATDQCFNTSSTMGIFTPGTERFGMVIAGIGCSNTNAYGCQMSTNNYNLRRQANYDGSLANNAFASESNQSGATTTQFAWDANPANTTTIASSTGATPTGFKVIDNEALILKFAATAGVTTPTGSYSVQADFIATTTF